MDCENINFDKIFRLRSIELNNEWAISIIITPGTLRIVFRYTLKNLC